MFRRPGLWKIPAAALGTVAFTLCTESAQAFFPPVPIGSDPITMLPPPPAPVIVPINPTLNIPTGVDPVVNDPVRPLSPPPFVPPNVPTSVPPTCVCRPPNRPSTVPEPMTVLSGLIGLGVVGLVKLRRRGETKPSDDTTSE